MMGRAGPECAMGYIYKKSSNPRKGEKWVQPTFLRPDGNSVAKEPKGLQDADASVLWLQSIICTVGDREALQLGVGGREVRAGVRLQMILNDFVINSVLVAGPFIIYGHIV